MPELNDRQYYVRRAAEARELAANATDGRIAGIHREMAEQYEMLAHSAESERPVLRTSGR